jgi:hypothetical protein
MKQTDRQTNKQTNKQTRCEAVVICFVCISVVVLKSPRGFRGLITVVIYRTNLEMYSMELAKAIFTQCYNKVNTVFDYCAV